MSAPETTIDTSAPPDTARIREPMLANLFAVFGDRDPDRRSTAMTTTRTT